MDVDDGRLPVRRSAVMLRSKYRKLSSGTPAVTQHVEPPPAPPSPRVPPLALAAPHVPSSSPVPWSSLAVHTGGRLAAVTREATGPQRLALLYAWYRDGHPPRIAGAEVTFHGSRGAPVTSARAVDWSGFPWAEAVTSALGRRIATPLSVKAKR